MAEEVEETQTERGVKTLQEMLQRTNAQIKADRALEISEGFEMTAKRKIEDLQNDIKILTRRRTGLLDLSSNSTTTLIKSGDIDVTILLENFNAFGLDIRNKRIQLNNTKESYNILFGQTYELETII